MNFEYGLFISLASIAGIFIGFAALISASDDENNDFIKGNVNIGKLTLAGLFVPVLLATVLTLTSCKNEELKNSIEQNNFYQFRTNRVAAEWEPAKGVMFTCPPVIPKELIIELAKDIHIYPIVDGEEEQAKAFKWFRKWGIDSTKVTFINLKLDYDIHYLRDWGPSGVFLKNGEFKLADVRFINSDPFSDRTCNDSLVLHKSKKTGLDYYSTIADNSVLPLANQLGMEVLNVPFTSTGGNVLTDGVGTAMSTCILLTENRFNGVSDEEFYHLNDSFLGYQNYHIISNFEKYGIQHIDCLLKLLDEETLLVAEPPEDHKLYKVYENIVNNELSRLKNSYGKPYRIKRIKLGRIIEEYLTAYTNSLILNKIVYVPLFGVDTDSLALKTWKSVMPGYSIKGINFILDEQPYLSSYPFDEFREYGVETGWASDDALHCRTRAIWDSNMTFISLNKLPPTVSTKENAILYVTVKDYGEQLENNSVTVNWRIKGGDSWNAENMSIYGSENHWFTKFPKHNENTVIEYYVEAISKSGKKTKRPMTAPKGFYEFKYVTQQGI